MNALWKSRPSPEALAEQAGLRGKIYRVQAAAFLDPPDAELLSFLAENYAFLLPGGFRGEEEVLQTLRVDFTNLFHLSGHPYEAALMDESGHLNSRATDRVTDFYRSCGFNPGFGSGGSRHSGVLAMDHLSAELEFVAHLSDAEEEGWRTGDRPRALEQLSLAARFMDEHLLRWMPLFTASLEEDAETGLYRELAKWTREFALEDRKHIETIIRGK